MNRRQKNQNATEKGFVVFYWPPMNVEGHQGHYVDRKYHLPVNPMPGNNKDYSYSCMVSMWEHFITYLNSPVEQSIEFQAFGHGNPYTNRPRLPVFRELSLSEVKKSVTDKLESSRASTASVTPSRSPMTIPGWQTPSGQPLSSFHISTSELNLKKLVVQDDHLDENGHDELEDRSVVTTSSDHSIELINDREEVILSDSLPPSGHFKQVTSATNSSSNNNGDKRNRDHARSPSATAKNLRTPRT
jgi:hypothetical protein